jgi:hypothetical protein
VEEADVDTKLCARCFDLRSDFRSLVLSIALLAWFPMASDNMLSLSFQIAICVVRLQLEDGKVVGRIIYE